MKTRFVYVMALFFSISTGLAGYDPTLGRWLSRDPLDNAEIEQGPNLYAYVANNPVLYFDPLGKQLISSGGDPTAKKIYTETLGLNKEEVDAINADQTKTIKACEKTIIDYVILFPLKLVRRIPAVTNLFPLPDPTQPRVPDGKAPPCKPNPKVPDHLNPDMHPNNKAREDSWSPAR